MFTFLQTLFGSLAGFFGQWLAKKTAMATAAVAVSVALTLALAATLKGLLIGFVAVLPSWMATGFDAIVPGNFPVVVSAVISAKVARFIYDWNMENLKLISYIT